MRLSRPAVSLSFVAFAVLLGPAACGQGGGDTPVAGTAGAAGKGPLGNAGSPARGGSSGAGAGGGGRGGSGASAGGSAPSGGQGGSGSGGQAAGSGGSKPAGAGGAGSAGKGAASGAAGAGQAGAAGGAQGGAGSPPQAGAGGGATFVEAAVTARTFAPLAGNVLNPERGFHRFIDLLDTSDLAAIRKGGSSLVYATVRLDAYRDKALPPSLLQDLQKATARLRAAGLKVVLRFAYNDGPYPNSAPDASAARILGHLDQLAPVLASEVDVIAVLQAGFIGAWGEWHTSTNGLDTNPEAWKAILQKVLDVVPKSRQTQVRTPHRKQDMFGGVLDPKDAFSGSAASRVGHVNDCFLASEDDFGTYEGDVVKWKSFVAKESPFVVVGGETCENAPPRSACATAKEELALLHFSYLNRDYHPDVIKGWQDGGCFDEIASKLGYRFAFAGAAVPETVRPGGRFALEVRIENTGYAAPFNERPVRLVLTGPAGRLEVTLSGLDPRRWLPGTTVIKTLVQLPTSLTAGTYSLSLWLPDASESLKSRSEYAVRLANAGTWEDATGLNTIGAFAVAPDASGSASPGATLGATEVSQMLP